MTTTFRADPILARQLSSLRARHATHRTPSRHCPDCLLRRPGAVAAGARVFAVQSGS